MRVLIVEDDVDTRDFLKRAFEAECHTVDATADGERGLLLGRMNAYDIIVLDQILPKKSGLEICRELRAAGNATPIIVTTVRSAIDQKVEMLNTGADDFLSKPYALDELKARMRAITRRPTHIDFSTYTVADLSLNSATQKITRGKREIHLTRKEFSILEYLMKHKGAIISRGTIMEYVWNKEDDPFSNTIESHILNLRRKIEIRGRPKLIHNVPGRGYKIELLVVTDPVS